MAERNYEDANSSTRNNDELDRALDEALAKYAAVEPRAGLEDRVLANLRAERTQFAGRAWWRWGLAAGALAVVVVALALAWRSGTTRPPETMKRPQVVAPAATEGSQIAHHDGNLVRRINPPVRKVVSNRPTAIEMVAATPKLDVFPSPRPLSEEELALARYVRNFPADANVVAKAQADSEKEVLAKMQALANESAE